MAVHKKYNRNAKVSALGRGLDALISTETVSAQGSSTINEVPIDQIEANPDQPRREFDSVALEELANSIKQLGLVQPITVRQLAEHKFQIIAGERRWRASQLAGLTAIPAYIRTIKDENVIKEMNNQIIHRGPDSDGYYFDKGINFGFRRLSIIDLHEGSQPILNENNDVAIIFNGEIYNYQEIKDDLLEKGYKFKTNKNRLTFIKH